LADEAIKKLIPYFLTIFLILALIIANFFLQVIRKPAELIGMFAKNSYKTTQETWETYEHLFKMHCTHIMTPHFLCGLAQVESSGNSLITPKWQFRLTSNISRIYAPVSSSVGLMQYTDATFKDAKRFCIHDHKVAMGGSCWFNFLYNRLSASHSVEMTSARLHYYIEQIIDEFGYSDISLENKHKLGAVIHLCGVSKGRAFAAGYFNFDVIPKCGSHSPAIYYGRIEIIMNNLANDPALN
jgi:hypothetical protein